MPYANGVRRLVIIRRKTEIDIKIKAIHSKSYGAWGYRNQEGRFENDSSIGGTPFANRRGWMQSSIAGREAAVGYKIATDERPVSDVWEDTVITSKVNSALLKDSEVKAGRIDVDTVQSCL